MAADIPVLETRGLGWKVGGFVILSDIDLAIRPGEFLSVIGPNGAGKSTLINLLSGVHLPTSGTVHLQGEEVTRMRPAHRTRRGLGRTFQTSSLFPGLTVGENARLAAQAAAGGSLNLWRAPRRGDAASRTAARNLEVVGLGGRVDDHVADLAHGDKRKLEVALVLCGDPQVLLLDEPTAGVGAEEVGPLVQVVRDVHATGRTVVMVEHRMELVVEASDRIAVLHHGRLLTVDAPHAVMAHPDVRQAYLGEAA